MMPGLWEDYAPPQQPKEAGPWADYQQPQAQDPLRLTITPEASAAQPDQRDSFLGKADAAVRGAADILTFGMGDELAAGADALLNPILGTGQSGESLSERYDRNLEAQRGIDKADAEKRGGYRLAGQLAGGLGGGVGLAGAGLLPSVNAVRAGAGVARTALMSAGEGAAMGAAQGFGSGEGAEGRLEGAKTGAEWGAGLGFGIPYATAAAGAAARRAITPFASNPTREQMVQALTNEGVGVTAGQRTGSQGLRYAESELGGNAAQNMMERQGEQFTAAALRRAGINANRATPDVIDAAFDNIGQRFDTLAARNTMRADQGLVNDLRQAYTDYASLVPETTRAPIVQGVLQDIADAVQNNGGTLPGDAYQAIRSRLERAARASGRDPELAGALRDIRTALDDAMERSIRPTDRGAWRQVRNQYRNLLVLEKAATGAGENAAQGIISPSQLRNATVTGHGRRNYARGQGDFAELARAGEAVLKPLPNSGTAGRLRAQNLTAMIPSIVGSGVGGAAGGIPGALAGAAAGVAVPKVAGALLMSPLGQAYLGNQAARELPPYMRALINATLNMEQSGLVARPAR